MQLACYHPPLNSGALDDLEAILHPFLGFLLIKPLRLLVRCLFPDVRVSEHQFNAELAQLTFPWVANLVVKLSFSLKLNARGYDPRKPYAFLEKLHIVFPHVTNLDLLDNSGTLDEAFQFICSFPRLESLTIFWGWVKKHDIKNAKKFRLPLSLKTIRCGGCQWEVMQFIEWLSVMEPTPRIVALTLFCWLNMSSLSTLLSKIGNTLQRLRLIPGCRSFGSDIYFSSKLIPYLGLREFRLDDSERQLHTHAVSQTNTALRYLDMRFLVPCHYMHHLPAYIRSTQVEEVAIMVAFLDGSDQRPESEISDWLTLDTMIVESLTAAPRRGFSLCLYIPFLTAPTSAEDCARSIFPRCSALGVLSFLYYDDVENANQTRKTRPVQTEFLDLLRGDPVMHRYLVWDQRYP